MIGCEFDGKRKINEGQNMNIKIDHRDKDVDDIYLIMYRMITVRWIVYRMVDWIISIRLFSYNLFFAYMSLR